MHKKQATLLTGDVKNLRVNKKLNKYYRQLGKIQGLNNNENIEQQNQIESNLLTNIQQLKQKIYQDNSIDQQKHRTESQKRAIIDSQLLKVKKLLKSKEVQIKKPLLKHEQHIQNQKDIKIQIIDEFRDNLSNDLAKISDENSVSEDDIQPDLNLKLKQNQRQVVGNKHIRVQSLNDIQRNNNIEHQRNRSTSSSSQISPTKLNNKFSPQPKTKLGEHLIQKSDLHKPFISRKSFKMQHIRTNTYDPELEFFKQLPDLSKMKKLKSSIDRTTNFTSNNLSNTVKLNVRAIGTPYIEKSAPTLQTIKPVNETNLSYTIVKQSPLNLSYKELYQRGIQPSNSFIDSIKPPKINALDIYNKTVLEALRDKKINEQRINNSTQNSKPPIPLFKLLLKGKKSSEPLNPPINNQRQDTQASPVSMKHLQNTSMTQDQAKLKLLYNMSKTQQFDSSQLFTLNLFSISPHQKTGMGNLLKCLDEHDPQAHIKALKVLKDKMNELLNDNQRQIEQMNDDSKFYEECRDLVIEVFHRKDNLQRTSLAHQTYNVFTNTFHHNKQDNVQTTDIIKYSQTFSKFNSQKVQQSLGKLEQINGINKTQTLKPSKPNSIDMIPLLYKDNATSKTVIKYEASSRDQQKAKLIKQLQEVRLQKNQIAKVLEKVLGIYDVLTKDKLEQQRIQSSPRTMNRLEQKLTHLSQLVQLCIYRFNFIIKEKTRILDNIFQLALPVQLNPLARASELENINTDFLNSIPEDQHAYQAKINTIGITGDLKDRLQYLNLMHKSLNIFQSMLAKKVQQAQSSNVKQKRFSPRNCVVPSSMESLNLVIEDFDLGKNYFDKTVVKEQMKKSKLQSQSKTNGILNTNKVQQKQNKTQSFLVINPNIPKPIRQKTIMFKNISENQLL